MRNRLFFRTIAAVLCAAALCAFVPRAAGEAAQNDVLYRISRLQWMASSGAGGWEGSLTIDPAGSFRGDYHDSDYGVEYRVTFFGLFGNVRQTGSTTYMVTVLNGGTLEAPGTQVLSGDGTRIVYEDTLFPAGSEWLLTLAGTPNSQIPETVRGEIGGTFLEWNDYSRYCTLSRAEDGWGFFAEDSTGGGEVVVPPGTDVPRGMPDSWLIPVPGRPGVRQIPVSYVSASSYIVNINQPDLFVPERMTDGIESTCWQFNTGATPLGGTYIYLSFPAPALPEELWIKNGFWRITDGLDQYIRNCRVKRMAVDFRYVDGYGYEDARSVTLPDDASRSDWLRVELYPRDYITELRIRIDDVYRGTRFPNDVAVSEIMLVRYTGEE